MLAALDDASTPHAVRGDRRVGVGLVAEAAIGGNGGCHGHQHLVDGSDLGGQRGSSLGVGVVAIFRSVAILSGVAFGSGVHGIRIHVLRVHVLGVCTVRVRLLHLELVLE